VSAEPAIDSHYANNSSSFSFSSRARCVRDYLYLFVRIFIFCRILKSLAPLFSNNISFSDLASIYHSPRKCFLFAKAERSFPLCISLSFFLSLSLYLSVSMNIGFSSSEFSLSLFLDVRSTHWERRCVDVDVDVDVDARRRSAV